MKISRARAFVAGFIAFLIVLGLATHAGTGTWSALGVDAIAAVCPVGILETMIGAREAMLHPLVLLIVIAVVITLFGKAFCAWVCPIPWLQRFFHPKKGQNRKSPEVDDKDSSEHMQHPAPLHQEEKPGQCSHACSTVATCKECSALKPIGGARDGVQFDTRHFALLGALGSAAIFGFPVFCLICPVGLTAATLIGVWHLFQLGETTWGLVVFPAILVLEVAFFRKWCAKICPISALMSLISTANRTFKPKVNNEVCLRSQDVDCHACVEACPEKLDPHSPRIPECSKCGACVEACPAHAIRIRLH